jgi:hypothetical protein
MISEVKNMFFFEDLGFSLGRPYYLQFASLMTLAYSSISSVSIQNTVRSEKHAYNKAAG